MLFLWENIQILYAFFEFLFHDKSSSFSEDFQFLNHFQINLERSCSLQSIACPVEISHFYFQFGNLVQGFCCCFFGTVEFDGLLVRKDRFIKIFSFRKSHTFKEISLRVFWTFRDNFVQILQRFIDISIFNISDASFQQYLRIILIM